RYTLGLAALAGMMLAGCGGGTGGGTVAPGPDPSSGLTLTAPANLASNLTGTLTLNAATSDAVAAVEFQIDGMTLGEDSSPPYQASVDTAAHAAGQHVVRARSRAAGGTLSAWSSATVSFGGSTAVPRGFTKTDAWVSGLSSATAFAQAGDGRMFVCEQG